MSIISFWKINSNVGYMSQWFPCSFKENDIVFNSAEQYMMYHKAILFNDKDMASKILITQNAATIKIYGRNVKNFDSKIWDEHKFNIVVNGNYLKFSQNPVICKKLLETGNTLLVEASPYDRVWGIGFLHAKKEEMDKWGENLLGKALMTVRDRLNQH